MRLGADKKIYLGLLAAILLIVFGRFSSLLRFPDSTYPFRAGAKITLPNGGSFFQKFTPRFDNLNEIQIILTAKGIRTGDKVKAELLDQDCEEKLREGFLKKSFLDYEGLYEFRFEEIPASKSQTYCLKQTFESPDNKNAGLIFYLNKEPGLNEPSLFNAATGEKIVGQSLAMRPVYGNANFWQDLKELNQRISQYKPWFLKHYFLYAVAFLAIFLSCAVIILLILI